jgi:hypothetical protein
LILLANVVLPVFVFVQLFLNENPESVISLIAIYGNVPGPVIGDVPPTSGTAEFTFVPAISLTVNPSIVTLLGK